LKKEDFDFDIEAGNDPLATKSQKCGPGPSNNHSAEKKRGCGATPPEGFKQREGTPRAKEKKTARESPKGERVFKRG